MLYHHVEKVARNLLYDAQGSDVACDGLIDDEEQCYQFDYWKEQAKNGNYGKASLNLKGWPSALIGGLVLLAFLIFAKSSDEKSRVKKNR